MPNREEKRKDYFIERFLEQTISISFYIVMDKKKIPSFINLKSCGNPVFNNTSAIREMLMTHGHGSIDNFTEALRISTTYTLK